MLSVRELANPFNYYLDSLAGQIAELNRRSLVCQGIARESRRVSLSDVEEMVLGSYGNGAEDASENIRPSNTGDERLFYRYPEIHNEVRMAFSHVSRALIGLETRDSERFSALLNAVSGEDRTSIMSLLEKCCAGPSYVDVARMSDRAGSANAPRAAMVDVPRQQDSDEDDPATKEVKGARQHLLRAMMDAHKGQFELTDRLIDRAFLRYLGKGIHGIKDGNFISEFEEHRYNARRMYEKAKLAEALGHHEVAISFYDKALDSIDNAGKLMVEHKGALLEAEEAHRKNRRQKLFKIGARFTIRHLFGF